ncbi:MAG: hypothetical protein M1120_00755 [Patescibacteria group bacterium]|nr:hypothetical protein [Patescibacteria group bacterium]
MAREIVDFIGQMPRDALTIARRAFSEGLKMKPEVIYTDHSGLTVVHLSGDIESDQAVMPVIAEACEKNSIDPQTLNRLLSKEYTRKKGKITKKGPEKDNLGRRTEYVVERKVTIGGITYFVRDDALYPAVVDPEGEGNDFGQHDNATEVILGTGTTPARLLIATKIQERTDGNGYLTSAKDIVSVRVGQGTLVISNLPTKWVGIPKAVIPKAAFNMRYLNIVDQGKEDVRSTVTVIDPGYHYKKLVAAEQKLPASAPLISIA